METEARTEEAREVLAIVNRPNPIQPGGIYLHNSAMGKLWTFLSDQQWHQTSEAIKVVAPAEFRSRLHYLTKHGTKSGAKHRARPKSHHWTIEERGSQIRMLLEVA